MSAQREGSAASAAPKAVPLLDVRDFSLEFRTRSGTVHALQNVGLSLNKGEIVGLVGESGSGKSVLAYSILGISDRAARITAGRAVFGGLDLVKASESDLADIRGREISMIFQSPRTALNPIRTVGRQIEDVLRRHAAVRSEDLKARAIAALREVAIADPERRYGAYPFELSGGMCQRVMIAIALACRPQLLIADEPTTGLDVTTQAAVMDLVVGLARERQMATLFITHDLGLAADYCDRIVVRGHGARAADADRGLPARPAPRRPAGLPLCRALRARDRAVPQQPAGARSGRAARRRLLAPARGGLRPCRMKRCRSPGTGRPGRPRPPRRPRRCWPPSG